MLKRDRFFAVSARDGSMRIGEVLGDGLWDGDTRILSALRVLVDGVETTANGLRLDDSMATFDSESGALQITRTRFVERGLHERNTVTNPSAATVGAVLEVEVESDFAAMLAVRGGMPELAHPTPALPTRTVDGVRIVSSAGRMPMIALPEGVQHQLSFRPGDEFSQRKDVVAVKDEPVIDFVAGLEETSEMYAKWTADCMSV